MATARILAKFKYTEKTSLENIKVTPEPVVIVAIWRINREVVHGQSVVSGEAAPMLHVLSC
jgi:hypothetical protein